MHQRYENPFFELFLPCGAGIYSNHSTWDYESIVLPQIDENLKKTVVRKDLLPRIKGGLLLKILWKCLNITTIYNLYKLHGLAFFLSWLSFLPFLLSDYYKAIDKPFHGLFLPCAKNLKKRVVRKDLLSRKKWLYYWRYFGKYLNITSIYNLYKLQKYIKSY